MKLASRPIYVKFAIASVAASVLLLIVGLAFKMVPLAPFVLLNWILFTGTGYLAIIRPYRWKFLKSERPEREKILAVNITLVVFTICGWIAIVNTNSMIYPNDKEQLRAEDVKQI